MTMLSHEYQTSDQVDQDLRTVRTTIGVARFDPDILPGLADNYRDQVLPPVIPGWKRDLNMEVSFDGLELKYVVRDHQPNG